MAIANCKGITTAVEDMFHPFSDLFVAWNRKFTQDSMNSVLPVNEELTGGNMLLKR